jgi:hypothetical protein
MDNFWKFATVAVAVVTLYIAFQQFWLAKEKLKLDLFEKRFAVFAAARDFLSKVAQSAAVTSNDLWKYRAEVAETGFLFGDDVTEFILEIDRHALQAWGIHEQMGGAAVGSERTRLANQLHEEIEWLDKHLLRLTPTFEPYMKFYEWRWLPSITWRPRETLRSLWRRH